MIATEAREVGGTPPGVSAGTATAPPLHPMRWIVRGALLFILAFANLNDIWSPDVVPNTLLVWSLAREGDLDLDETLGPLLDPLGGGSAIPPAADPTRRLFTLARIILEAMAKLGRAPPRGAALLRMAQDIARAIDLFKTMTNEDDRQKAAVYMDGLSQMRSEWAQGKNEDRDVEQTLGTGWGLFSEIPESELTRVSPEMRKKYYGKR